MANTEIRLIIFFAAKDGKALYTQQKQDWELTVALIMLEWVAISFSRGSSPPMDQTQVSCTAGRFFTN